MKPAPARLVLLGFGMGFAGIAPTCGADAVAPPWRDRVAGALYGFAIGDAMAAEIEKWPPARIAAHYGTGDFEKFIPPLAPRGPDGTGKGDGRISDDTLELEALMRAYVQHGDHLDAHGYVSAFLPELTGREVWIAEKHDTRPVVDRPMWWPERFAHLRNAIVHADPRQAGQGNWLNQGLACFIWPVGAVNAGDPARAYAEAVAFGSAHTESYALEAAAVLAAAYAEALGPQPTVERVLAAALTHAQDGTRRALEAVLATVDPADEPLGFAAKARQAWLPFSGLPLAGLAAAADTPAEPAADNNVGRPSRIQSVETVPAALAAFKWSRGDLRRALRAGVLYGFDAESIAAMAAGLAGAIHGTRAVPPALAQALEAENRRNYRALAAEFAAGVERIAERDVARLAARHQALTGRP
jgi:ADP-ribosylglycohydrolase